MINLQHMTCSSSIVYSMHSTCYNFTSQLSFNENRFQWITPNPMVKEDSLLPALVSPLFDYYYLSYSGAWFYLYWRPVVALMIGIVLLIFILLKTKTSRWIFLGIPLITQSMLMYLVNLAPDFRYYFSDGLIALFLLAVFLWALLIKPNQVTSLW